MKVLDWYEGLKVYHKIKFPVEDYVDNLRHEMPLIDDGEYIHHLCISKKPFIRNLILLDLHKNIEK